MNNFVFSRHGWENPKADIAFRGKVKGLSDEAIEVKKGGGNMKLPPIPKTEVTANKKWYDINEYFLINDTIHYYQKNSKNKMFIVPDSITNYY